MPLKTAWLRIQRQGRLYIKLI